MDTAEQKKCVIRFEWIKSSLFDNTFEDKLRKSIVF